MLSEARNGKKKPYVYACMPCYGHPHPAAARQFWAGALDPDGPYRDTPVIKDDKGSSLLGNAFDLHWATALNMQLGGYNITRFAMLHADVVPQEWWLDQLLHDLDETGADVVAGVVAITDLQGLTSTAIDDPADPWDVLRRLTVTEVMKLPEIFTAADCGYPNNLLLANTGCWVCDFTRPWCRARNPDGTLAVNFAIRNGIQVQPNGFVKTVVASEDWEFSRKVGRLGGKVVCTKRLKLVHMGELPFPNDDVWGRQETDNAFAHKFDGKSIKEDVPAVNGWLKEEEGRLLARLAEGKEVLEIGSWCGRSTVWMARTAKRVYCIDPFDSRTTLRLPRDTLNEFLASLSRYGVRDKVGYFVGESQDALPEAPRQFDFAFIDGAHDRVHIEQDVRLCLRVLRPRGLIAFHDYSSPLPGDADVRRVVDGLLHSTPYLFERVEEMGSILVLRLAGEAISQEKKNGETVARGTTANASILEAGVCSGDF